MADQSQSTVKKCLLVLDGARNTLTIDDTHLTVSRLNAPLIDSEFKVPLVDIVGVKLLRPGQSLEVTTAEVVSTTPFPKRIVKTYVFTLSPQRDKEPFAQFFDTLKKTVEQNYFGDKTKKILVLVNPFGGTKIAPQIWKESSKLFEKAEIPYEMQETQKQGHATTIVNQLPLEKYRGVVCVSGDGLLTEVINGILTRSDFVSACSQLSVGVIPGGSGNGLASTIDCSDPVTATLKILRGKSQPMDVFSVLQSNKRTYGFMSVSWATLSVIDLQSESYRWLGSLRFDIKGVVEIFSCESYKGKITYLEAEKSEISGSASSATSGGKSDETAHDVHDKSLDLQHVHDLSQNVEQWKTLEGEWSWFLAVSTPKITTSKAPINPTTSLNDGTMDLMLAPAMDRVELAQLLLAIDEGQIHAHPKVKVIKVKAFTLEPSGSSSASSATSAPISIDGERTDNSTVKVEVHPRLIKLFS